MLDWLLDPFAGSIMQRALAEVLLLGLACGPLGVWVLLYRQSYAAESISHAMLPGLVLAALAGLPLLLGAAGGVLAAAAAIALAGRDERLGPDAGVAVAISFLFGLGAILALSPESPPRLQELLFGDLLGVTGRDLGEAAVLVGAVGLALAAGHRFLSLSAFDRLAARSLGARPGAWELLLLAVLALCTVAAVRGLGNLLLVALILAPGAAALRLAARLPTALALAAALAGASGLAGLLVSYHLEVAAGASVALAAVTLFLLALLVTPRARPAAPRRPRPGGRSRSRGGPTRCRRRPPRAPRPRRRAAAGAPRSTG
jgi:ABC-type Mn2+/Zn2+ transport system permease subunit